MGLTSYSVIFKSYSLTLANAFFSLCINASKEVRFTFSAFDLAVALMELDEVCQLVTDPKYAYGKAGKYVAVLSHFLSANDMYTVL